MKVPFSDYALGAGVATDLVNTAARVRSAGEALAAPADLERFLAEHDVRLDAVRSGGHPTGADVEQVRALREDVREVLESDTDERVVDGANALVLRAAGGPTLERTEAGWQWHVRTTADAALADELGAVLGMGLLGALRTLGFDRFRHCAAPTCDGMFVDTSRAGRRRYCMPALCGNRVNVANHRARRRPRASLD